MSLFLNRTKPCARVRARCLCFGSRKVSGIGNTSRNCQSREGVLDSAPCKKSRVLLAMDGSEHALAASRLFRMLNAPATSQATVRHVVEPADDCVSMVIPLPVEGRPVEGIIRAAGQTHADLALLGSQGMTGLKGAFLCSKSCKVVRRIPARCWSCGGPSLKERADGLG